MEKSPPIKIPYKTQPIRPLSTSEYALYPSIWNSPPKSLQVNTSYSYPVNQVTSSRKQNDDSVGDIRDDNLVRDRGGGRRLSVTEMSPGSHITSLHDLPLSPDQTSAVAKQLSNAFNRRASVPSVPSWNNQNPSLTTPSSSWTVPSPPSSVDSSPVRSRPSLSGASIQHRTRASSFPASDAVKRPRQFSGPTVVDSRCDEDGYVPHHPRRSSVAIKFSPTYLDESAIEQRDMSGLKRPPTPIAERILKGDFSFD